MVSALFLNVLLGVAWAEGPVLVHLPVFEAPAEQELLLEIAVNDLAVAGQAELLYRRVGAASWRSLGLARSPDGMYEVRIPAAEVLPPGIEYMIKAPGGAYASEAEPQRVQVLGDSRATRREQDLARYNGQPSRFSIQGWYTDFGNQEDSSGDPLLDRWYGGDVDFTYRILGGVRSIRFGVSRLWAQSIFPTNSGEDLTNRATGLVDGYAELEFRLTSSLGLKTMVQLGANAESFTAGGRGTVRLGHDPGSHVELYGGGVGGMGVYGGMKLAWDTVPRVPMSAGIEVTNWPTNRNQWAVRLLYDMEVPMGSHAALLLGLNYQARASDYGMVGGRGGLAWSF